MHSSDGNSGFVGREELQQLFLPEILRVYVERGYAVRKLPSDNGQPIELETILQRHPQVTELSVGGDYVALPPNLFETDGADVQMRTLRQMPQYRGLKFIAINFVVTATGIEVREAYTAKKLTLTFFEYYEALEKWLPQLAAVPPGKAGGR